MADLALPQSLAVQGGPQRGHDPDRCAAAGDAYRGPAGPARRNVSGPSCGVAGRAARHDDPPTGPRAGTASGHDLDFCRVQRRRDRRGLGVDHQRGQAEPVLRQEEPQKTTRSKEGHAVTRRFRDWLSPRGDDDAELDALLAETWEDGAATLAKVLDIEAGKAALLAARDRQETTAPSAGRAPRSPPCATSTRCWPR